MSIQTFSQEAKRKGWNLHRVPVPRWVSREIEAQFKRFCNALPSIHADIERAVHAGTITPDLGEIQYEFGPGTSATVTRFGPGIHNIGVPYELDRQFAKLARAHGLTPNAALGMLLSWRVLHGWDN